MAEDRAKIITVLLYQYSVIVKGMERKLKDLGYNVAVYTEKLEQVVGVTAGSDLFIFYLPSDIADDREKLEEYTRVCASVRHVGKNMLIMGERKYHSELMSAQPLTKDFVWLDKPVDNDTLKHEVEKAINTPLAAIAAPAGSAISAVQPQGAVSVSGGIKNILIVDDDPAYAGMVKAWIKDFYHVDIVTAGVQAITFLAKKKVDLILLDYEMPIVDGPQVLQMLRQEEETANIPVIFLTGVSTKEGVQRVMALKPDGYLLKSTTREDLLSFLSGKL